MKENFKKLISLVHFSLAGLLLVKTAHVPPPSRKIRCGSVLEYTERAARLQQKHGVFGVIKLVKNTWYCGILLKGGTVLADKSPVNH